jgi:hypothetical protein
MPHTDKELEKAHENFSKATRVFADAIEPLLYENLQFLLAGEIETSSGRKIAIDTGESTRTQAVVKFLLKSERN